MVKVKMNNERHVTDAEVREAYFGGDSPESKKIAQDNRGIIRGVARRYSNILSRDELESCGLVAIWRCLRKHDTTYNRKFTSSLHQFMIWECIKALGERKSLRKKKKPDMYYHIGLKRHFDSTTEEIYDEESGHLIGHIKETLSGMKYSNKCMIRDYFYRDKTFEQIGQMNGYTKEAARQKVGDAVNSLYQLCRSSLGMPIRAHSFTGE